ncbi:MAG: excalibur calcium-binding domain-containing protein [Burkholderiaceae bacterium]|nr:excalibur calcium-binding domain-containing protein [Burkholderiaceae bacterium]
MCFLSSLQIAVVIFTTALSTGAIAQVYKCVSNGSTTYQNTPCPAIEQREQPSVEQLNLERKKKLAQSSEAPINSSASAVQAAPAEQKNIKAPVTETSRTNRYDQPYKNPQLQSQRFSCDRRKYCSQMTSCAEAKYFLSNCPGVNMDGNKDGIPCEQQWCSQ